MTEVENAAAKTLDRLMLKLAEDGDAILSIIDKIVALEKSGVLDKLAELTEFLQGISRISEVIDEESVQGKRERGEEEVVLARRLKSRRKH